ESDGRRRFVTDSTGQFLVYEQGRVGTRHVERPAAWPADSGDCPAGHDYVAVTEQAKGPVALTQTWRFVRTIQQFRSVMRHQFSSPFGGGQPYSPCSAWRLPRVSPASLSVIRTVPSSLTWATEPWGIPSCSR